MSQFLDFANFIELFVACFLPGMEGFQATMDVGAGIHEYDRKWTVWHGGEVGRSQQADTSQRQDLKGLL